MAYLAYRSASRFAPQRNAGGDLRSGPRGLHRSGAPFARGQRRAGRTFQSWAEKQLRLAIPWLSVATDDDAPSVVSRMKKHPALLRDLERRAAEHQGRRNSRAS